MLTMLCFVGRIDVSKDATEGFVQGELVNALLNTMPLVAILSILGVVLRLYL